MAVVYIIPGFHEHTDLRPYRKLMQSFREKNYTIIPVTITWKYRTMRDYVEEFLSQFQDYRSEVVSVFGFSFGAMITLLSAPFLKLDTLYLCSLSPYFREDLDKLTLTDHRTLGTKRVSDFKTISFREVASQVRCCVNLIVGEKESDAVQYRFREAGKLIRKSKTFVIEGARHELTSPEYINTLCYWIDTGLI